jgi:hypothetical protein
VQKKDSHLERAKQHLFDYLVQHTDDIPQMVLQVYQAKFMDELPTLARGVTRSELLQLRAQMEIYKEELEYQQIKEISGEVGQKLFGTHRRKCLPSLLQHSIDTGSFHEDASDIEITRAAVHEHAQAMCLIDLAKHVCRNPEAPLQVSNNTFARVFAELDLARAPYILEDKQYDDEYKRAVAIIRLASLHFQTHSRFQVMEVMQPFLDAKDAKGNRLLSEEDLLNIHNICLTQADTANQYLAMQASTENPIDGVPFFEVIGRLVDPNDKNHIRNDYISRRPYICHTVNQRYRNVQVRYFKTDDHYRDGMVYRIYGKREYNSPELLATGLNFESRAVQQRVAGISTFETAVSQIHKARSAETASVESIAGSEFKVDEPTTPLTEYTEIFDQLGLVELSPKLEILSSPPYSTNRRTREEQVIGLPIIEHTPRAIRNLGYILRDLEEFEEAQRQKGRFNKLMQKLVPSDWKTEREKLIAALESGLNETPIDLNGAVLATSRNPADFRIALDTAFDEVLAEQLEQQIALLDVERPLAIAIDIMSPAIGADGTILCGNIKTEKTGYSNEKKLRAGPPPKNYTRTKKDALDTEPRDVLPEYLLIDALRQQYIDGLNKAERILIEFTGIARDIDRQRFPLLGTQVDRMRELRASLDENGVNYDELNERYQNARQTALERIQPEIPRLAPQIPAVYRKALGV